MEGLSKHPGYPGSILNSPKKLALGRLERRGPRAENKAVTDATFIRFRGPKALNDRVGGTTEQLLVGQLNFEGFKLRMVKAGLYVRGEKFVSCRLLAASWRFDGHKY